MKVQNLKDEIELTETSILIRKTGFANAMASGVNGERSIAYEQVTSIGFKLGGKFSLGFIQFSYAGSTPFRGGLIAATQDPDAFIFQTSLNVEMQALKAEIESRIKTIKASPKSSSSLASELSALVSLRDNGDLTADEFQAAKARLIAG